MKVSETLIDLSKLCKSKTQKSDSSTTTTTTTALRILDTRCLCGEGILYDDQTNTIMFVDIEGKCFHILALSSDKEKSEALHTVYALPKMMGSYAMLAKRNDETSLPLLCAWEDGFQIYDVATDTELSPMSMGPDVNPAKNGSRLNDGRVDPTGKRFICGGYYGEMDHVRMQVFKLEQRESDGRMTHVPIIDDIRVANALCWSLDGNRMYFTDSPTKAIVSYAYDKDAGTISDRQLLRNHEPSVSHSVPDGACVDSEGYIWNAIYNWGEVNATGVVHRIHPDSGEVVYTVELPDGSSQVTCCCFGGEQLDILFITTAAKTKQDLQPHAGGIYAVRLPFTGRKENRLDFSY
ncbi:hypothetical protein MPSEU_000707700 [Mayamaea pseudoterrestris]|nr:hypothetical protein MPSEU_000707700 [Mayamaea pseudoterrestris]